MNWYYIDGPLRVGPLNETEWAELVRVGKITPETLVWHEGLEKWTPYGALPPAVVEPPDFEEAPEREPEPEDGEAFAARVVDCDYPVSLGGCVSRAWAVFKPHVRILAAAVAVWVGFNYLTFLAASARLSALEMALPVAILGVLTGGLYQLYLRLMRGQEAGMAQLLVGFRPALLKPLALQSIFSSLVTQLCFLPFGIAAMMMGLVDEKMDYIALNARLQADPNAALVLMLVFLTCSIPAVYFGFCWMFAPALIVDKGMRFWPAMQLSRRKVLQHPWRVGILSVVAGILGAVGIVGFGIGILFTLPLYFLIVLFLYEDMFNKPSGKPAEAEKG